MSENEAASVPYGGFEGVVGRTFAESEPSWPAHASASSALPNVVVVLVDDMGYSDLGCFGGEIATPNLDALAERGLRYRNFHVAPKCSPTRASLLTGINHHRIGFADVPFHDPGFPGYAGELPADVSTLPEVLKARGYSTLMVGKWHLTREDHVSAAGPRSGWPLQRGFDQFYGIMGGFTNLHMPDALVEGNSVCDIDSYPEGYYLTDDLTDRACAMLTEQKALAPDRPFFLYFSHLAVHAPLHAKEADIAKYAELYRDGWDVARARRHARLIELGLWEEGTALPTEQEAELEVIAWADLSSEEQDLFARYGATYAAMVDNIDQSFGRLCQTLDQLGELDNTLILFLSDNGATAEGGSVGSIDYLTFIQSQYSTMGDKPSQRDATMDALERLDLIGGPRTMPIYPRGWAQVSNTPFRLYKSYTHAGGRQVPLIMSWPNGISARGEIRKQWVHVTDVVPTVLDLLDLDNLTSRFGLPTLPLDGKTFAPTIADPRVESSHTEQYFELAGNRGYYRSNWEIVSRASPGRVTDPDSWELYDLNVDPTETTDLAEHRQDLVDELAAAWDNAAWQHQVFPIDDRSGLKHAFRDPAASHAIQALTLYPGTPTLNRLRSRELIHTRSFRLIIRVDLAPGDAGTLVAHGDQGGGYLIYVSDGDLRFAYNYNGQLTDVVASQQPPAGETVIVMDAHAPGGGLWDIAFTIGSETSTPLRVPMLWGMAPFQGIDIGIDRRSPVSWDLYERHGPFSFNGNLHSVTYEPGEVAPDSPYLADPETLRRLAQELADRYD